MNLVPRQVSGGGSIRRLREEMLTPEHAWTALAFVVAGASAAAGRNLLKAGWRATSGTEPPISPSSKDATWIESLVWGVVTGAIIGVVRAVSRQGARSAQHRWG